MGMRGPKSQSLAAVEVGKRQAERPKPLPGMSARARALWRRVVESLPPEHFAAADLPLLRDYCEAYDRTVLAQEALARDGLFVASAADTLKAHPANAIKVSAASVMAQLATKLGISRSARRGKDKDAELKPQPTSKRKLFGA